MYNNFNNKRPGIFFLGSAMLGVFMGLAGITSSVSAQTPQPFGFENNSVGSWVGYSSSESVTVNSSPAYSRTGVYSLKMNTTSSSSNKQWYTTVPYDTAYNGTTTFFIYWAKIDVAGTTADASLRHETSLPLTSSTSSDNASGGVALSTTAWTRVTNAMTYTSSSARYFVPAPRKTSGGAAQSIYMDDGVLYSSTTQTTVDTFKPNTPTAVTGVVSGNLVSLKWVTNVDNPNSATGVQATLILRNTNTSAAAPLLNDQAQYSVAGGASGPNTASGGWQIISTAGPADSTYLDPTPGAGNYIYAVVLQDMAYNYSLAAVSSTITANAPVPTIFVNQAGYNGNFGSVAMGSASSVSAYIVSAYNLTSNFVATAPAGFQVSLTRLAAGFGTTVSIAPVSGNIVKDSIFVRFAPTVASGVISDSISNTSTGANTIKVPVSGNAIAIAPTTTGTITFGGVSDKTIQVNLPTVGNGTNRIIVISAANPVTYLPVNGTAVTGVNADYSLATDQGSGNKVVYDGTGNGNTVVTVINLHPATLYYFSVFEYNKGTGTTSQSYLPVSPVTALVKTDTFNLAVNNVALAKDIKIYPNPTMGTVHVSTINAANIILHDVTGRTIYTSKNTTNASIDKLANGIYIITITNDKGELLKQEKIIVAQ